MRKADLLSPVSSDGSRRISELIVDVDVPGVDLEDLADWIERLVASLAPEATSLAVRLSSNDTVRDLNESFRHRPEPTDVLSFPGGERTPEGLHLGDVVIAVPVAATAAARAGSSLRWEIQALVLHGVLHCLGHDHETDEGEMDALELDLRRRWVSDDE